jgi:hypothetical protein
MNKQVILEGIYSFPFFISEVHTPNTIVLSIACEEFPWKRFMEFMTPHMLI